MAIDTHRKKLSMIQLAKPFRQTMPVPDGSFAEGDRRHLIFLYFSGIEPPVDGLNPLCGFEFAEDELVFNYSEFSPVFEFDPDELVFETQGC